MPEDETGRLRELAVSNRERIKSLEAEMQRARDRLHDQAEQIGALSATGLQVKALAEQIRELAEQVGRLSRRAIEKPRASTVQVVVSACSAGVALAALLVTFAH